MKKPKPKTNLKPPVVDFYQQRVERAVNTAEAGIAALRNNDRGRQLLRIFRTTRLAGRHFVGTKHQPTGQSRRYYKIHQLG